VTSTAVEKKKLLPMNIKAGGSELPWLNVSNSYGCNHDYLCTVYVRIWL